MKILVTGAAGFIGFHLVQYLVNRGEEVVGLDCINDYYDVNLKYGRLKEMGIQKRTTGYNQMAQSHHHPNYQFIKLKLEDKENMEWLFANSPFDMVCNLAAQAGVRYSLENPQAYVQSNVVGFVNVLECCRHFKIKHLVYASSSSVYGLNKKMPLSTTDSVGHQVSLYAATKRSNELLAHTYSHLYGIPTTGLRFFTVYGPWGRPDMAYFLFLEAILADKPIKVFNRGNMSRDFTYIADIIQGIVKVLDHPAQGDENWDAFNPAVSSSKAPFKVYNIGNNKPVKLLDFIEVLEEKIGKKAEKIMMPMQPGDVHVTYADVKEIMDDLGYQPNTPFAEGIQQFVDWYLEFYRAGKTPTTTQTPSLRRMQRQS